MTFKILILIVGIGQILQSTEGLKCFVCNTAFDEDCDKNPPPYEYYLECSPNTAQPIEIKQGELKPPKITSTSIGQEERRPNKKPFQQMSNNETTNVVGNETDNDDIDQLKNNSTQLIHKNDTKYQKLENALTKENEIYFAHLIMEEKVNYTFCRKTITRIPKQHNKDNIKDATHRITRSCGWIHEGKMNGCKWTDSGEIQVEYCTCNTKNGCNGASTIVATISSIPLIVMMISIANFIST